MTTSTASRVELTDVDHRFDADPVLRSINLTVSPGDSVALLGPSGCGKTTLLRVVAGLERPERGTVTLGDQVAAGDGHWIPPEARRVGMVFQDWALFPHLSVGENVAYGLERGDRRPDRVQAALELVGLSDLTERAPETLSGGQQQRVALARALAPRPRVLLLDEPFSNLDAAMRVEVRSEVHRLLKELDITSIFVTHDQEEAFLLGDHVAVMLAGEIVQHGLPRDIYTAPVDRRVAEFIGAGTMVAASTSNGLASTPFGPIHNDAPDGPVDLLLRPEQLTLTQGDSATVELVEYYGHDAVVFVNADGLGIRVRTEPDIEVRRGDRVSVVFAGAKAVAFPRT